jgi:hypothetical protein
VVRSGAVAHAAAELGGGGDADELTTTDALAVFDGSALLVAAT